MDGHSPMPDPGIIIESGFGISESAPCFRFTITCAVLFLCHSSHGKTISTAGWSDKAV